MRIAYGNITVRILEQILIYIKKNHIYTAIFQDPLTLNNVEKIEALTGASILENTLNFELKRRFLHM